MNLKQKTIKGLFWAFASHGGKQISQLIITVILARLLRPSDFGLLAMVTVFTGLVTVINDLGVSRALIQKSDINETHLSSAFWMNIFTGVVLTLIFISLAPIISKFYNNSQIFLIFVALSFNFFVSSFGIIQQTIFTKNMDFKQLTICELWSVIIAGIVSIYLAYRGFGVWSLVYQLIIATLINTVLLWKLSQWRPKLIFSLSSIKDIFSFSANVTWLMVCNYFTRNIDSLLIGKFIGSQGLGFYSLAYKLMMYPLQNISWVITKVMFPVFSKIQDNLDKVRYGYTMMLKYISLIAFPIICGLFVLAPELVRSIFGAKWLPSVSLIRILCICGLMQSIGVTGTSVLLSQGKAAKRLYLEIINLISATIFIAMGLNWGMLGVASMYTLQQLFYIWYFQKETNYAINLHFIPFVTPILKNLLISLLMMLIVYLAKVFTPLNFKFNLPILILLGFLTFAAMLFATERENLISFLKEFKSLSVA